MTDLLQNSTMVEMEKHLQDSMTKFAVQIIADFALHKGLVETHATLLKEMTTRGVPPQPTVTTLLESILMDRISTHPSEDLPNVTQSALNPSPNSMRNAIAVATYRGVAVPSSVEQPSSSHVPPVQTQHPDSTNSSHSINSTQSTQSQVSQVHVLPSLPAPEDSAPSSEALRHEEEEEEVDSVDSAESSEICESFEDLSLSKPTSGVLEIVAELYQRINFSDLTENFSRHDRENLGYLYVPIPNHEVERSIFCENVSSVGVDVVSSPARPSQSAAEPNAHQPDSLPETVTASLEAEDDSEEEDKSEGEVSHGTEQLTESQNSSQANANPPSTPNSLSSIKDPAHPKVQVDEEEALLLEKLLCTPSKGTPAGEKNGAAGAVAGGGAVAKPVAIPPLAPRRGKSQYEVMYLPVVRRRMRTGLEAAKDLPIERGTILAGRYELVDFLGSAAFSRAVEAIDLLHNDSPVCLKIIKNKKEYVDQGLDEISVLKYLMSVCDPDEGRFVRLLDFFYHKEHLILVTELLRDNLYEFGRFNRSEEGPPWFTLRRVQAITKQILECLRVAHRSGVIHADLKPENILIKSYSRCLVKVIDFGSSCFSCDTLSTYIQSRAYRAPEVILGMTYGPGIDIWSLGCIVAEMLSGKVLFENDSVPTMLARIYGTLGPWPKEVLKKAPLQKEYFTPLGLLYEQQRNGTFNFIVPAKTPLHLAVGTSDPEFLSFLTCLLELDPAKRVTAEEALCHPWFLKEYPLDKYDLANM
eukprot:GCRY01001116.1.p1 GENE.GCRY01001116.1~~GCRY01001116.1.p1  ORF type:complete len:754 (+),score=197.95 GCRY01001116.1:322-2583(+)